MPRPRLAQPLWRRCCATARRVISPLRARPRRGAGRSGARRRRAACRRPPRRSTAAGRGDPRGLPAPLREAAADRRRRPRPAAARRRLPVCARARAAGRARRPRGGARARRPDQPRGPVHAENGDRASRRRSGSRARSGWLAATVAVGAGQPRHERAKEALRQEHRTRAEPLLGSARRDGRDGRESATLWHAQPTR